jgi:hypothetical protein
MRALIRCVTSLWLVVLWGCDSGKALAEITAPILKVSHPPLEPKPWAERLFIRLSEGTEECPDLSGGTRAFFNDIEVPMSNAGHFEERGSFPIATPEKCHSTVFMTREGELPHNLRDEVTRIRLQEGDTVFHAEAFLVCAPRGLTMTSPAGGALRSGDEVELEWQPATDVLTPRAVKLRGAGFFVDLANTSAGTLRMEGNRLRFRVPQLAANVRGAAELEVLGQSLYVAHPQVTRCEGFAECRFDCSSSIPSKVPVTVLAPQEG